MGTIGLILWVGCAVDSGVLADTSAPADDGAAVAWVVTRERRDVRYELKGHRTSVLDWYDLEARPTTPDGGFDADGGWPAGDELSAWAGAD